MIRLMSAPSVIRSCTKMNIATRVACLHCAADAAKEPKVGKFFRETAQALDGLLTQYNRLHGAVETTLAENLHLADGDQCTLKILRDEFVKQGGFCPNIKRSNP